MKRPSYLGESPKETDFFLQNYCLAFVDLLGQRNAMEGHALLPEFKSVEERNKFIEAARGSVGKIAKLHKRSKQLLDPLLDSPLKSKFREQLSEAQKKKWDQSQTIFINDQRWSDGLVYFTGLSRPEMVCPVLAVMGIFMTVGSLAFLGLAERCPIRGALDISWGVELNPREIYGPVVARAAHYESSIAGAPRIVVSDTVLPYLDAYIENPNNDDFSEINRQASSACKDMLLEDSDGILVLNYLSDTFKKYVTQEHHNDMYKDAFSFVNDEIKLHSGSNEKLLRRYELLRQFFLLNT